MLGWGRWKARVARVRANADAADREALTPLHDQLLRDSEVVLNCLREGVPIPNSPGARTALEALVQLEGRPALRLTDDGVDPNDPELGEWQGAVVLHPTFAQLQRSVGRIDMAAGVHAGTGFVVGDGLVMTNRHVLETLAFPTPTSYQPGRVGPDRRAGGQLLSVGNRCDAKLPDPRRRLLRSGSHRSTDRPRPPRPCPPPGRAHQRCGRRNCRLRSD